MVYLGVRANDMERSRSCAYEETIGNSGQLRHLEKEIRAWDLSTDSVLEIDMHGFAQAT